MWWLLVVRSIGCTVVEMLTCHPPLYDMEPMAALFRIATQPVSVNLPPHCSEHVDSFLKLCFLRSVGPITHIALTKMAYFTWLRTHKWCKIVINSYIYLYFTLFWNVAGLFGNHLINFCNTTVKLIESYWKISIRLIANTLILQSVIDKF